MIFVSPDVSDLKLPAKHYTPRVARDTGYTLLFAHASGMHKEQWEPAIEVLLANPNVRDAWSFDWPSHGEGATINSQVLRARDKPMCMNIFSFFYSY
jgi:pimeloyl-ACP methyl ester carboxylesterase